MSDHWVIRSESSPKKIAEALQEFGFAIIPHALPDANLARLTNELTPDFQSAAFCEGLFYGHRTKRLGKLLSRSKECQELALHRSALGAAESILGGSCQSLQLNLTQAIEIWPGSPCQVPHRDRDIWLGNAHHGEMMLNAMWALDDFTVENGGTLVWPKTHLDLSANEPTGEPIVAEMPRGSLCLFLGSTLHCGGANWTRKTRRGVVMSYCLGWLKPCENPWLSYPPEIASDFPKRLRDLIGYHMDSPSLNNVDGRCPSEIFEPLAQHAAFADLLTDDQIAQIEKFNSAQSTARQEAA